MENHSDTRNLDPGDHLCFLYETEEEHRSVLTDFLREGLKQNHKMIYVVDTHTSDQVLDYLRPDEDVDVEQALENGQLTFLSSEDSYLQGGIFDPDFVIEMLRKETGRALDQGYAAFRITGETSWAIGDIPGSERLSEYEAKLDDFFSKNSAIGLCQYHRKCFRPENLKDTLRTHPFAVIGNNTYRNSYYMPPAELLGESPVQSELENWMKNLSQHAKAEEVSQKGEIKKFQEIFDNAQDAMYFCSVTDDGVPGHFLEVNDKACEMFGYSRDEFLQMTPQDLETPEQCECVPTIMSELFKDGSTAFEVEQTAKDGSKVPVEINTHLFTADGERRILFVVRDITERKQYKETLEYRLGFEERISAASTRFINCTPEEFDQRVYETLASIGEFVEAGRAYVFEFHDEQRLMSNTHEWCAEGVSPQIDNLQNIPADSLPWWTEQVKNFETIHLRNLDDLPPEAENTREVLEPQNIKSLIVVPLALEDDLIGFIGFDAVYEETEWSPDTVSLLQTTGEILTNALQRHRFQQELKKANAELKEKQQQLVDQERQRALTIMTSGIAHDFNNALSPIQGFSKMLLDNPEMLEDREKTLRYLNHIHKSATSAAETIRRMRKFYRPDEETKLTELDLNSVITDAVSVTKPRWKEEAKAAGKAIEIQTQLGDIPTVIGNEAELNDVMTNLIFNAADAMREGGRISVSTYMQDEQHVVLEFSDNGTGMTEETKQKCIDPFYTEKGAEGSGLGLATVQGVVRRHSGELSIDSTEGEGTTFYITLPVAKSTVEPGEQKEKQSEVLKILAVEDEEAQRELLHEIMIAEGHQVETASNGIEGIEKFNTSWFDLVITDRAMPEINGDDLAAKVKEAAPQKSLIMLTGFGDMMDAAGEKPENVDAVISKPVTKEKLRKAMGSVLSGA